MKLLISKLHYLIILYIAFGAWERIQNHQKQVDDVLSNIGAIEAKILQTKKEIKQAKAFLKDLEASRKQVKEVARQIEVVQKQLPTESNDSAIMGILNQESIDLKFKDAIVTPQGEVLKDFYFTKDFSMNAIGTFLQSLIFFERLDKGDRLLNVKSVKLETVESEKKGRFQLVKMDYSMEAYRYNPNYKQETGIEEIKEQFKNKGSKQDKEK